MTNEREPLKANSNDDRSPDAAAPLAAPSARHGRFGWPAVILAAIASALLAGGGAVLLSRRAVSADAEAAPIKELYQCPMHPSIIQDHPGECPICGMKLVKVESEKRTVPGLAVVGIDPERQQLIGLKTAPAIRQQIGGVMRTAGKVAIDETRVRRVNVKNSGFVDRVFVDFVGKRVKKGERLFTMFSPELLAAQNELLLAMKTRGALGAVGAEDGGQALVDAARRRLALWDVSQAEILRLEQTGRPTKNLTFYSPAAGVVTKKDVVEGMKLDAGAMPYEIVDLSAVWVLADVYESELRFVKEGTPATLTLKAFPGRAFEGKVVFLDPLLDPQTRTVKVRLAFPNPSGELRPEMFGEVVLKFDSHEALVVPADAVIDSGTAKVVFVAHGDGKFAPRQVEIGQSDGAVVEVASGIREMERVVTRANFLVDSESRLRASLDAISPATKQPEKARVLPLSGSQTAWLEDPADRDAAPCHEVHKP